jgi:PLP dependent protein
MTAVDDHRRAELVSGLGSVRARIADACGACGRDPRSVTLIAITKTYPATDVAILASIGMWDVGESRDQEASAKVNETHALLADQHNGGADSALRWHFVGRLQKRKCRSVASYAYAVHSVDRSALLPLLAEGIERAGRDSLDVFVQVSLDGDPERGGVTVDKLEALADQVAAHNRLRLAGVMAVAPLGADPDAAFADLAAASARVVASHPEAGAISAGMSDDLESAITHGSTHVRVGTALLGRRTPLIG